MISLFGLIAVIFDRIILCFIESEHKIRFDSLSNKLTNAFVYSGRTVLLPTSATLAA